MYLEDLPDQCPPLDAQDVEIKNVWRLVESNPPMEKDFFSFCKLEEPPRPNVDMCRWSSCSLFAEKKAAESKAKLPKLAHKRPVCLSIPKGSGRLHLNKKSSHIDFWAYAHIKFCDLVHGEPNA